MHLVEIEAGASIKSTGVHLRHFRDEEVELSLFELKLRSAVNELDSGIPVGVYARIPNESRA